MQRETTSREVKINLKEKKDNEPEKIMTRYGTKKGDKIIAEMKTNGVMGHEERGTNLRMSIWR